MSLGLLLKLIHVLISIWFIAGLIGRTLALRQAARTGDIRSAASLGELAGRFERLMVIPGSSAVFIAGLLTAWAQGWPILGFLQGGNSNWLLASIVLFLTAMPAIPLVFLPRGRIFEEALREAQTKGTVTPELRAAFADPAVAAARSYEAAVIFLILVLMVLKPF